MLTDLFDSIRRSMFPLNIAKDVESTLQKFNSYYVNLSPENKLLFKRRLLIASATLDFTPNNFPKVTNEMIVLITSALVQVTFGLKNFKISRFRKIIIVPFNYNFLHFQNLMGHVDYDEKCIVLSWPSVKEGYIIPNDAMNVALHEIAHALQEENRYRILFNKFFENDKMAAWSEEAAKKLWQIRKGKNRFLKNYGGINMLEMYSVCIETFFEQPEGFKENLPILYQRVSELLNQDPLRKENPIL